MDLSCLSDQALVQAFVMSKSRRDYDTYLILEPEIERRGIKFLNFTLNCQFVKIIDKKAEVFNVTFKQKGGMINEYA
jgi:hypothetical protein